MSEEWRGVVGWEDLYQVSPHGRVRSLDRVTRQRTKGGVFCNRRFKGKIPRPRKKRRGYVQIGLYRDHGGITRKYGGPRVFFLLGTSPAIRRTWFDLREQRGETRDAKRHEARSRRWEVRRRMRKFARWNRGLVRAGFPPAVVEHGLDVVRLDRSKGPEGADEWSRSVAAYVAKGLAAESTMGAAKEAKGQNRTVFELMRDALLPRTYETPEGETVETLDMTAQAILHEYQEATKGRRQLTWSRGLREAAQLDDEKSDEEIAAEDLEGEDVAVISRDGWKVLTPRASELLSVTEVDGPDAARAWLDSHGIEWWAPTGLTSHYRRE